MQSIRTSDRSSVYSHLVQRDHVRTFTVQQLRTLEKRIRASEYECLNV